MHASTSAEFPPLPDPVADPAPVDPEDLADDELVMDNPWRPGRPGFPGRRPWRFRSLREGCWLIRFTPTTFSSYTPHYDGTMRVERVGSNTIASGDLYRHRRFPRFIRSGHGSWGGRVVWIGDPEPDPRAGIPVFARNRYDSYLRITDILEGWTIGRSFNLGFERHRLDSSTNTWTNEGVNTARMSWSTAPSNYPDGSAYLIGDVKDDSGAVTGRLTMGWVSRYFRKATIELDSVTGSEIATDNGLGEGWQDSMDQVGWQVEVEESDRDVPAPSGDSWSDAEMHAAMLTRRAASDLDREWRYHLLHVRRLDSTSRGIMYDAYGGDSNSIPREGVGIATHWNFPRQVQWGDVRGTRFGAADGPFYRTAVHELGHALGLHHNTASRRFMNTTGVIANGGGPTFPANIIYEFEADDAKKLRHWPDPRVRPGGIPFGQPYAGTPLSPNDDIADLLAESFPVTVDALLDTVPLGAPVRVDVTMTNDTDDEMPLPEDLGFKSGFVSGSVTDGAGVSRRFRSVVLCVDDEPLVTRKPEDTVTGALTLLRGPDGPLFPAPGLYQIDVEVNWDLEATLFQSRGSTTVMVTGAENQAHAEAAMAVLSEPDLLLTLALGGDHMEDGVEALDQAMDDPVLCHHYAVTKAKQLGRSFYDRKANVTAAAKVISDDTVMSGQETASLAKMVEAGQKGKKRSATVRGMVDVLSTKVTEVTDDKDIIASVKGL